VGAAVGCVMLLAIAVAVAIPILMMHIRRHVWPFQCLSFSRHCAALAHCAAEYEECLCCCYGFLKKRVVCVATLCTIAQSLLQVQEFCVEIAVFFG
jgi:hypothetical protein